MEKSTVIIAAWDSSREKFKIYERISSTEMKELDWNEWYGPFVFREVTDPTFWEYVDGLKVNGFV